MVNQTRQSGLTENTGIRFRTGKVVNNKDPEGLGRVQVIIEGENDEVSEKDNYWLEVIAPTSLGGSAYTQTFSVPQINTMVKILSLGKSREQNIIIGSVMNRPTNPNDPAQISIPQTHPYTAERVFTEAWDVEQEQTTAFSNDFSESYPYSHGWVDNANNYVRHDMSKRTTECMLNSGFKFKTYADGSTVVYIPKHLKIVVGGDFQLFIQGNRDEIINQSRYTHILGDEQTRTDGQETHVIGKKHYTQCPEILRESNNEESRAVNMYLKGTTIRTMAKGGGAGKVNILGNTSQTGSGTITGNFRSTGGQISDVDGSCHSH